jgi:signal transduction histidine kinase
MCTAGASPREEKVASLASVAPLLPGVSYPFWRLLTPQPSIDPWWPWLLVGGCFLAAVLLRVGGVLSWSRMLRLIPWLASLVTIHFFVLASVNGMSPFYAVGSTMAGMAPVLFIRGWPTIIGYSALVGLLSIGLYLAEPDARKIAYWGSLFPVLALGYYHVERQARQRKVLEDAVASRTRLLSDANARLVEEIEERTRLEEQLRLQQRLEAVGRLAGGVAHDFNNVLSTIGVYSELLEKKLPPDDPLRSDVEHIQRANREGAAITQQLLTVGRRSPVQTAPLDLDEVIADSETVLRHLAGAENDFRYRNGAGRHLVLANEEQMRQVLINLVKNARHAIQAPGRLEIETALCTRAEVLAPEIGKEPPSEHYVRLSVSDTGSGIPTEMQGRIFDPFFTTKGPEHGSGLGLAIVQGIVGQAGGFIRVESQPGRGTRFDLYWPAIEGSAAWPAGSRSPALPAGQRILLVEDDDALRDGLARVLRDSGYDVEVAGCAEGALQVLRRGTRPFDLVVTDVVMAGMTGLELMERIASEWPGTRVLLISGNLDRESLARTNGRFPLLVKPFPSSRLLEEVAKLLSDQ